MEIGGMEENFLEQFILLLNKNDFFISSQESLLLITIYFLQTHFVKCVFTICGRFIPHEGGAVGSANRNKEQIRPKARNSDCRNVFSNTL